MIEPNPWALSALAYLLLVAWLQVRVHRHVRRPRCRNQATRVHLTVTAIGEEP